VTPLTGQPRAGLNSDRVNDPIYLKRRGACSRLLLEAVIMAAIIIATFIAYSRIIVPEEANPNPTSIPTPNSTPTPTPSSSSPTPSVDTVKDIEGNIYRTVKIGDQVWMAENLRTTKYNDGQDIPLGPIGSAWGNLTAPAYCWLYYNPANGETYGALYNWYVVDTGKLAPSGWRVPTNEDWIELAEYLGGEAVAGGKLKERGTSHWFSPNAGATDEYSFSAISSSTMNYDGYKFYILGDSCYYWSAEEFDASDAWVRQMACDTTALNAFHAYKTYGRSIRLIKNST
jgi:uncharacterized protein (TIGR02145 family)